MSAHVEEHDEQERAAKRVKLDSDNDGMAEIVLTVTEEEAASVPENLLPSSRILLGTHPGRPTSAGHTEEFDVGISEYISKNLSPIHAIIKQRFTDFLVNEVNLDGDVIHVKSLDMPHSEKKQADTSEVPEQTNENTAEEGTSQIIQENANKQPDVTPEEKKAEGDEEWSEKFDLALREFLSEPLVEQLKQLYIEGSEPPFVGTSDNGWAGRSTKTAEDGLSDAAQPQEASADTQEKEGGAVEGDRGKRGKRGRDRGGRRGGRGGHRGGQRREDTRKVISDPMDSKASRTALHKVIRELFKGKFDTQADTSNPDDDPRIVIRWAHKGRGRDDGRRQRGPNEGRGDKASRGNYPPYIHFTLQKTNRDTQDALGHLARTLHVNVKEFSVAGTKDKRGVTVQRVALRRNGKTVEDVWKLANGINKGKTPGEVITKRGERGVRIADFNYRKSALDLGMLKGNVFVITLRNVQVEPIDTLNRAMESLKTKGFINYYGMQRFGTASIPTHAIGLAFLQSDWHKAISLILRHRPGEHPDVVAARDAWLKEGDLDKALELMPRRVVAERCILESFKKQGGDTRNAMGALSTIPRNLRLMYVHAYQSYVWNAIVSERIRMHGAEKPVPGDIVFEKESGKSKEVAEDDEMLDDQNMDGEGQSSKRKPWEPPRVKTLTEEDLDKYSIFDVIMPLPGKDVAYPGGELGDRYREFLKLDGLDPDNFVRKQKEYSLGGSYRKILHLPKQLSWSILRYTDPEVPLAQSDEDKLLGFEPPVIDEDGKFIALQVQLELGTASYATMALREVTKTETSSHYQTVLTQSSEDQMYRGTGGGKAADEMKL